MSRYYSRERGFAISIKLWIQTLIVLNVLFFYCLKMFCFNVSVNSKPDHPPGNFLKGRMPPRAQRKCEILTPGAEKLC